MSGDAIELSLPADPRYLAFLRVAVRGAAAAAGLGVDRVDDAAQAMDEAAAGILEGVGPGLRLDVLLTVGSGSLRAVGEVVGDGLPPAPVHDLALAVLGVVADRHEVVTGADRRGFDFTIGDG